MSISTRKSSASSSGPSTRSSILTRTSGTPKKTEFTSSILKPSRLPPGAGNKKTSQAVQRKSYSLRNSRQNPEPTSAPREVIKQEKTLKEFERKRRKASKEDDSVLFLSDSSENSPKNVVPNPQDEKESQNSADVEIVIVSSDDEKTDSSSVSLSSPLEVQLIGETSNDVSKGSECRPTEGIEVPDDVVHKRPVEAPAALEDSSPDASSIVDGGSSAVEIKPKEEVHKTSSNSVNSETRADSVARIGKVKLFSPNASENELFSDPEHQPSSSETDGKTAGSDIVSGKTAESDNVSGKTADSDNACGKTEESDNVSLKPEPNSKECDPEDVSLVESTKPSVISKEPKSDDWNEISDVNLASPTFSDRPVSSNSRSTTSTSSAVQQDHDLYSPGSTDLSMSEDSRGSFKESGSEKTVSTRKSRGRVKSRLNPRVVHRSKRHSTQVSSSCSPSEDGSVEPPAKRSKRLPYRVGITWEIGHRLEAVDQNEWYPAKIVEVDKDACEILIHFEGWSARFDEWVPMDSPKLRPPSTPNPKAEAKDKQTALPKFKPNEKILARWNDGKLYDATVTEVLSNGYYGVLFYDGFLKKLPVSAMRKLEKALKDKKMPLSFPSKLDENKKSIFQRATRDHTSESSSHSLPRPPSSTETTPPGSTATKQFVVEPDHNQFKCPVGGCSKAFRKENLLQSHIKHYHSLDKDGSDLSGRASPVSPRKGKSRLKSLPTPPLQVFKEPSSNTEEETQDLFQKPTEFPDLKIESEGDGTSPDISNAELELDKENRLPKEGEPTTTTAAAAEDSSVPEQPEDKTTETSPETQVAAKPETRLMTKPEEKPVKAEPTVVAKVVKAEPTIPPKVVKASPRKAVFPVTKMETRHAKPCLFRDDSIYTGYISYRSLYAKNSRGSRKNTEGETKKGKPGKNEEEKAGKTDGEPKRRRKRVFSKTEYGKKQKLDYSGIDEEIAEIKKRRVDRVSESSVKTDDTTKDSIDIDDNDDEDETVSDQPEVYDDEVVRCICENEEENGLMFQCEDCKTWQHAACFNIENEEDVPDKYFCYLCTKPKGIPSEDPPSANDLWLNNGVLATFSFLKDKSPAINRPNAILATHKLVDSTNQVLGILKCLQHKIHLAGSGSHLELKCWSKPWKQTTTGYTVAPQKLLMGGTHVAQTSSMPTQPASDSEEFLVFDHAYFSHSDNVIDLQEEVVTGQPEDPGTTLDISLAVSEVSSDKPAPVIQEPKEKILPRRRMSTRESTRGRGGRFREPPAPVEEVADIGTCKNNLVQHIHDVQNNVEHSLDVIESHLNLLEAEMGVSGSNENDLETALRSLKSLSKDLDVIQRFTFV